MKPLLALTVVFSVLVGSAVLFFTAYEKNQAQLQQTSPYYIAGEAQAVYTNSQNESPSSSSLPAAASSYRLPISVLDNDQDHDGNYDGIADLLAGLAPSPAVLVIAVGLVALVGVKLLLILCEPPKLSSIWLQVLERPG